MNRFKLYRRLRGGYWVFYLLSGWHRVDRQKYDRIRKQRVNKCWSMEDWTR